MMKLYFVRPSDSESPRGARTRSRGKGSHGYISLSDAAVMYLNLTVPSAVAVTANKREPIHLQVYNVRLKHW